MPPLNSLRRARIAAFKLATRNMAKNIDLDPTLALGYVEGQNNQRR
jgi:hypothetical protein